MENNQLNRRIEHLDNVPDKDTNKSIINPNFTFVSSDGPDTNPDTIVPDPPQDKSLTPEAILDHIKELSNPFPIEVLPPVFREFVEQCHKCLGFPIDYTALAVLTAVSTAIGKSAQLRVKSNWFEYAAIFAGIIGKSGVAKSHPLDIAFRPFVEIDRESIKWYNVKYEEYKTSLDLPKKDKDNSDYLEKPVLRKFILTNFTTEVLYQRLSDNERSCVVISDELATFLEGMNNYSKGDQTSTYLSIWSNKSTSVDRINKDRLIWLEDPFLNMIGSFQPRIVHKLFPPEKLDNGFFQRLLLAFPDNAEKQPINDNQIPDHIIKNYSDWIKGYIQNNPIETNFDTGKTKPKIYKWDQVAKLFFYEWQKENTAEVNEYADSVKGEILSKFDIHFVRLSLILQAMDNYNTDIITHKSVMGASKLCRYFIKNSFKVLDILENVSPASKLPVDKQNLYNSLPDEFTTSQAIEIGIQFSFNEKAVKRLIADKNLFTRLSQGHYSKKS
jgi:hypothetical protein